MRCSLCTALPQTTTCYIWVWGSEQHGVTCRFFIIIGEKKIKDARFLYFLNDMLYLYSTILTNFADEFTTLYIKRFLGEYIISWNRIKKINQYIYEKKTSKHLWPNTRMGNPAVLCRLYVGMSKR